MIMAVSEGDLNLTPEVEGELKRFGAEAHVFRKVEWLVKEADEARKFSQDNNYPPPHNKFTLSLVTKGRAGSAVKASAAAQKPTTGSIKSPKGKPKRMRKTKKPTTQTTGSWRSSLNPMPHAASS
jgi:hypothetical protein